MKKILLLFVLVITSCGISDDSQYAKEIAQSTAPEIYEKVCFMCHNYGAMGAPKLNDPKEWHKRLEHRSISELIKNTVDGFNGMPKKGACMQCTDEQLKEVVKYMINTATQKVPPLSQ